MCSTDCKIENQVFQWKVISAILKAKEYLLERAKECVILQNEVNAEWFPPMNVFLFSDLMF
jgi:hypothetical protein